MSTAAMDMRAAELAANHLAVTQRFLLHALVLGVATLVATAASAIWFSSATFPLAVLTAGEGLVVIWAHYTGRELIQRLALEPIGQQIPAVRRYSESLLRQPVRDRLAASIDSLIAEADLPGTYFLSERITLVDEQLRLLSRELASPDVPVQATSLVDPRLSVHPLRLWQARSRVATAPRPNPR